MDDIFDFKEFEPEQILKLKGVFLKDILDFAKLQEEKIQESLNEEIYEIDEDILYNIEPLPTMFKGIDTWVKKTQIHCYYCDLQFQGIPCFIPTSIESTINGEIINVYGCFCWFNCAVSFIDNSNFPNHKKIDRKNMLYKLYNIFTGNDINYIHPSPNKFDMCKYGGTITEIEYKNMLNNLKFKV